MDNIIVATFSDERSAIEGLDRLSDLDRRGDILVYNRILLRKSSDENFEFLKKETDGRGWQAIGEMAFGGLVGLFGGPVGVIVGMIVGAAKGAVADIGRYALDRAFVQKVTRDAPVGTTSIVAEASESDVTLVDRQLEPLGAEVWRNGIYAEHWKLVRSNIDALASKIKDTNQAVRQAQADDKAAIKDGLIDLGNKLDARFADIDDKILQEEMAEDKANLNILRREMTYKVEKAKRHFSHKGR